MSDAPRMFADALLLSIVLGAVPTAAGHALLHGLRSACEESAERRLLLGLSIGLAAHLVALSGGLFFFPVQDIALWLSGAAVAMALLIPGASRALARDLKLAFRSSQRSTFAACIVASIVASSFVLARGGGTVQGTDNLDAFHYVATAAWLQQHPFDAPLPDAANAPMREFVERAVTFSHPFSMPRVASEALLAHASSVLGRPPEQLFSLLVLGIAALLALGTFSLLDSHSRGWSQGAKITGALLAGLSPITLFTHANANFPTLVGATLLCSAVLAWPRPGAIRTARPRFDIALLLAALACAYPELVPVAGLALLVLAVESRDLRVKALQVAVLASTCLLSLAAFWWAWWLGARSLVVAQRVSAIQGTSYPSLFAGLDPIEGLGAFLTLAPALPQAAPAAFDIAMSAALVLVILLALATERQPRRLLALSAPFIVLVAYVFLRDFNYGKFKVVQYLAPFLTACVAAGIIEAAWRQASLRVARVAFFLVAVIAAMGWVTASAVLGQSAFERSRHAHLTNSHREVGSAAKSAGAAPTLLLTDEHSLHDAFWAAYFWEPRPVLMLGGLAGWSANPLERLPPQRLAQIDYVLESPVDVVQSGAGDEVFVNQRFVLRAVGSALVIPVEGMSGLEPGFRWIGQEVRLLVRAARAIDIRIDIAGQFPANAPDAALVGVDNANGRIEVRDGQGSGTIEVAAGIHIVTLRVTRAAVSPASLGVGSDPRPLTYQIRMLRPVLR